MTSSIWAAIVRTSTVGCFYVVNITHCSCLLNRGALTGKENGIRLVFARLVGSSSPDVWTLPPGCRWTPPCSSPWCSSPGCWTSWTWICRRSSGELETTLDYKASAYSVFSHQLSGRETRTLSSLWRPCGEQGAELLVEVEKQEETCCHARETYLSNRALTFSW